MLGSRLVDGNGRTVWAEFGAGAIDLGKAEGRNLLALPMGGAGWPQDGLRPDGALEKVKISFGLDFKFEAYSGMRNPRRAARSLMPREFCGLSTTFPVTGS